MAIEGLYVAVDDVTVAYMFKGVEVGSSNSFFSHMLC